MISLAQLWIGKPIIVYTNTIQYLQQQFCKNQGCSVCTTCFQIKQQQHHAVLWLEPEKTQYTISSLEPIFKTISYACADDQPFFIILQKADLLTHLCANSLLKSLEEPPTGYHFILLAEREDQILPTIHSRCVVKQFKDKTELADQSPLFTFFTMKNANPLHFLQIVEKENLSDRQAFQLIETIIEFWQTKYQTALHNNDQEKAARVEQKLILLTAALEKPPMPGSAKLFLKNLFLSIQ